MRVVVDTNVLFEGLTRKGDAGRVVDLWVAGRIVPCVSTALALEYEAVLTRGRSGVGQQKIRRALQALLSRAEFVPVSYTYRPQSPDPGDDHVIDCVMNGRAALVTSNVRDFRAPAEALGFTVLTPHDLLARVEEE